MSTTAYAVPYEVEARARQSLGISDAAIYRMVARALDKRHGGGGVLVDVGCGAGQLWPFLRQLFARYVGVDVVRYEEFPAGAEFTQVDLDTGKISLPDEAADVVAAVETIEHLENPRAFVRELVRLVKPDGWVIVTTPNQLSLLSLITLLIKHRFSAFQDVHYPAHLTALLEVDLKRIAAECVEKSGSGSSVYEQGLNAQPFLFRANGTESMGRATSKMYWLWCPKALLQRNAGKQSRSSV